MFINDLGGPGSIPGHVIPKTLKMVLDTSLINTQLYKVHIEGKVKQSRERSSTLPYTFWLPLTSVANFTLLIYIYTYMKVAVISTITHLYCELFYIQILTMVIITETLTSTSHHDIFTYLDYIFSCYLHTVGFYPYLLSYTYIYIWKSFLSLK